MTDHLPFKKYGSIDNVESGSNTMMMIYGKLEAIALEKAHGAHFSFQTDGDTIECSRRREILTPDENFYNYQTFADKYKDQIMNIFTKINSKYDYVCSIQVDGELIGGSYDHPEVKEDEECARVQKEVMYSPNHQFFAYDIYCFRKDQDGFYLDYDLAEDIFQEVKLLYAEPLARGTFYDMCQLCNVFETTIPDKLDLPPIEKNFSEGFVIKLVKDKNHTTGSRIILKSKNKDFSEVKIDKDKSKKKSVKGISPEIMECVDSMITMNRLNNVISKIGEVCKDDFPRLMKDFNQDILKDFPTEYPEIYASINKKTIGFVKKYMNGNCRIMIEQYLIEN